MKIFFLNNITCRELLILTNSVHTAPDETEKNNYIQLSHSFILNHKARKSIHATPSCMESFPF